MLPTRMRLTLGLAALAGFAACAGDSRPAPADGDLQRDLQLAGTQQGIELVPNASRAMVVSPIEQTGAAEPARAPTKTRAPVARPRPPRVAPRPRVVQTPVRQRRVERPAPKPTFDADVISPPPPGGYKTVGEVIRNAPFPIKPVAGRR